MRFSSGSRVIQVGIDWPLVDHVGGVYGCPYFFRDTERWDKLKALNHERKQKFHLVTEKWVIESVEEKRLLEERGFVPRAVPTACPPRVVSTFQGLFDVE